MSKDGDPKLRFFGAIWLNLAITFLLCSTPRTMAADAERPGQPPDLSAETVALSADNSLPVATPIPPNSSRVRTQQESEESAKLQPRQICDIRPSLEYAWGDVDESTLPEDFSSNPEDEPVRRVIKTPLLLQWQPSDLWYHPLYFEDPVLERYGHTHPLLVQSLVSTGRFLGQTVAIPYQATLRPAQSREYPLGWYRPGEYSPHLTYQPAWNDEAAVTQALSVVGLFFLIP